MEKTEIIKKIVQEILESIDIAYLHISTEEGSMLWVLIETQDPAFLTGKDGENIYALNHMVQKLVSKKLEEDIRLTIDINGYKKKEKELLIEKTRILADRAKNFKLNIALEPMSSYERLIIHEYFSQDPLIQTESSGEGKDRHLILKYTEPV